jgi:hypothetical protein
MYRSELKPHRLLGLIIIVLVIAGAALYLTRNYQIAVPALPVLPTQTTYTATLPPAAAELPNASCHTQGGLPDAACTPGVANIHVTQANINQTICVSGYTKTIRPPVSYTDKLKAQQMAEYGFTDSIHLHEEDHLISLELGGDPSDPKNLWPEPGKSPNPKDKVENDLHAAVCSGRMTLLDAQTRISTNWTTAEQGL